MKITKIANCGKCDTFQPPKGHLDTQMYPECEGTKYDRNIVKKTVEKRKHKKHKKEASLQKTANWVCNVCDYQCGDAFKSKPRICPKCGERDPRKFGWAIPAEDELASMMGEEMDLGRTAKKKKEWDPNPWAVCHTTVDKDEDPAKFERCVQHVKDKQKGKKKKKKGSEKKSFNLKQYRYAQSLLDLMVDGRTIRDYVEGFVESGAEQFFDSQQEWPDWAFEFEGMVDASAEGQKVNAFLSSMDKSVTLGELARDELAKEIS